MCGQCHHAPEGYRSPPGNTHHKAAQIQQFEVNLNCNEPGQPSKVGCSTGPKPHENPTLTHLTQFGAVETYLYPAQVVQLQPVPPPLPQHQAPLQLQELVFCGLQKPCPCVVQLRPAVLQLLELS